MIQRNISATILVVLLSALSALAQSVTGNIIGTVIDPSGAVVVDATAVLTGAGTSQTSTVKSSESGLFRFLDVPAPAHYNLKVQAAGFKALEISDIELTTSETRDLGKIQVQLGSATESVEVTANAVAVQTATADRSSSLDGFQIDDVPLKGRDPWSFISTLPGIIDQNASTPGNALGIGVGLADRELSTHFSAMGLYVNGQAYNNNNRSLDGISSVDQGNGNSMFLNPSPDAISEVKVVSSGAQAEYGRNNGGSMNFIIKGGSNKFHGSAYWNHRNEDLNANTFFDNRVGTARPLYRYFLAGYTIGGPIIIPKLYRNRNKLFFFGGQDFTRVRVPTQTVMANEPTALERSGNFSTSRNQAGTVVPIIDPTTRTQFAGNIIPGSRIDPTGLTILNLQNLPNGYTNPAPGQQYTANYIDSATGSHKRLADIARLDYNINSKNTLFVRAGEEWDNTYSEFAVAPGIGLADLTTPSYAFAAHLSSTLSSNMVNEFTFGLGHDNYDTIHPEGDSPYYRTSALSPQRITPLGSNLEPFLPAFTFGGNNFSNQASYNPFGGGPSFNARDDYAWRDDVSKVMGNHNVKAGVYLEKYSKDDPTGASAYAGTFNFTSTTANPLDTGNSYANALLGVYQTYTETETRLIPASAQLGVEFYIQDNWRLSHRLTLDYGIRAYHMGTMQVVNHTDSGFYPSLYDPASAPVLYRPGCTIKVTGNCPSADQVSVNPFTGSTTLFALQGTLVPGVGNPADGMAVAGPTGNGVTYSLPALVFAPRFGLAWDPFGDGKTSIRAAVGTFFNRPNGSSPPGQSAGAPLIEPESLDYGNISQVSQAAGTAAISPVAGGNAQGKINIERSLESNLTIQHQIGSKTLVDIGWAGNFTRHANESITLNPIPEFAYANPANLYNGTEINQNFLRTAFPGMGAMTYYATGVNSLNYNGLQAQIQRREKNGHVEASYVFSKALGYNGWDAYHSASWFYGPLGQDRSQALSVNFSYNLPGIGNHLGFVQHLVNGWILSGVFRFQTGAPVTPGCTSTLAFPYSDPSESGVTARCQVVADPKNFTQNFFSNFNTAAFTLAPVGTFGNIGLNTLRDPSWWNIDAGLDKEIVVGSSDTKVKRAFRIRLEAYNALNHTEFNQIGTTYSFGGSAANLVNTNTTTGQDIAANASRVVETTVRFSW
jgi:hypothetical protein